MKTSRFPCGYFWRLHCTITVMLLANTFFVQGQETVIFGGQVDVRGTNYFEQGMLFRVVIPTFGSGSPSFDGMGIGGPILAPSNVPYNNTPYMIFRKQFSPDDYVIFSLTNGSWFGLTSVRLADPNSPSSSQVPISFVGHLFGGSTVTNTFTTPGGGANSFLNYTFNANFNSGLTSVDILAPKWAMDNLVFTVPEPASALLLFLGGGLLVYARSRQQC